MNARGIQPIELEKNAGFDVGLLLITLFLCICGAVFVLTSSAVHSWQIYSGDTEAIFWDHLTRLGLGILALITLSLVNYRVYQKYSRYLVCASILLLLLVLFLPQAAGATARRWIYIAGFSFQPAELAKFTLIAYLATRFAEIRDDPFPQIQSRAYLGCALVTGATLALVLLEPNLSMAVLIVGCAAMMFFVARVKLRAFLIPGILALSGLAAVTALNPYMRHRLTSFVSGIVDPMDSSYHVRQSLIGIGSGGLSGVGLGQSAQKHFFLPEPYNDFIFSIIGEELGFLGSVGLLICFLLLLSRGWRIARRAPDNFGYFLAAGITFTLALSFVINIGVTMGLLPATGQPLPFISYGGTSLMMSLGAIGILLNVSRQSQSRRPLPFG